MYFYFFKFNIIIGIYYIVWYDRRFDHDSMFWVSHNNTSIIQSNTLIPHIVTHI